MTFISHYFNYFTEIHKILNLHTFNTCPPRPFPPQRSSPPPSPISICKYVREGRGKRRLGAAQLRRLGGERRANFSTPLVCINLFTFFFYNPAGQLRGLAAPPLLPPPPPFLLLFFWKSRRKGDRGGRKKLRSFFNVPPLLLFLPYILYTIYLVNYK